MRVIVSFFVVVLMLILIISGRVDAQQAGENFDYSVGDTLTGKGGSTDEDWAGPWQQLIVESTGAAVISEASLELTGDDMPAKGRGHKVNVFQTDMGKVQYNREMSIEFNDTGDDIWLGFLFQGVLTRGVNALNFTNDGEDHLMIGKLWESDSFQVWTDLDSITSNSVVDTNVHWLVVMIATSGDSTADSAYLWIDRDIADEPDLVDADLKFIINFDKINGVRIHSEGGPFEFNLDEINVGWRFADIIPEPEETYEPESGQLSEVFDYTVGDTLTGKGDDWGNWSESWQELLVEGEGTAVISEGSLELTGENMPAPGKGHKLNVFQNSSGKVYYNRGIDDAFSNTGDEIWLCYLFQSVAKGGSNAVMFTNDGENQIMFGNVGDSVNFAIRTNVESKSSTVPIDNEVHWLIARIETDMDTAYLWIDPDSVGEPDIMNADVQIGIDFDKINGIRIHGDGGPFEFNIDEINVGWRFADIIPESATECDSSSDQLGELFNYTVGDTIAGKGQAVGNWAGAWQARAVEGDGAAVISRGSLELGNATQPPHQEKGHKVSVFQNSVGKIQYDREMNVEYTDSGNEIWMAFLYQSARKGGTNAIMFTNNGEDQVMFGNLDRGNFELRTPTSLKASNIPVDSNVHWLVVKIKTTGDAAPDEVYMWIDPLPSNEPAISQANVNIAIDFSKINGVRIHSEGGPFEFNIDEINIGTSFNDIVSGSGLTGPIPNDDNVSKPKTHQLGQNYPNPFNPATTIEYTIVKQGRITLTIYNLLGQKVITLFDKYHLPGTYRIQWDSKDRFNRIVPSGTYIYRLADGKNTLTNRMLFLK